MTRSNVPSVMTTLISRGHRFVTRAATKHVRINILMLLICLEAKRQNDSQYLPVAVMSDQITTFQEFIGCIRLPSPELAENCGNFHQIYFTDGGCIYPTCSERGISFWAII